MLGLIKPTEALSGISELSVFLIVLSAGLEMEFGDIIKAFRGRGLVVAALGFFIPFFCGLLLGALFRMDAMRTVFLGLCISITALPVAIRILGSFQLLGSPIARYAIATAILNDVLALLCLGVILDMPGDKSAAQAPLAVFFCSMPNGDETCAFRIHCFPGEPLAALGKRSRPVSSRPSFTASCNSSGVKHSLELAVLFVLIFASMSETLGSHFVIGAFFGALLLSPSVFGTSLFSELENTLHSITGGFLAPIFFAFLGLQFSVATLKKPFLVLSILIVSIGSKVLAGWLGGRWAKLDRTSALGIGIILNGRGIMELVVANIALQRGFIGKDLFSTLILMGVVTTVLTPILFRRFVLTKLVKTDGGLVK